MPVSGLGHAASRGDAGGCAVNPFTTPDAIYISKRPQDMRAGIHFPNRRSIVSVKMPRWVSMAASFPHGAIVGRGLEGYSSYEDNRASGAGS